MFHLTLNFIRPALHFFPLLSLVLLFGCVDTAPPPSLLSPSAEGAGSDDLGPAAQSEVALNITLTARQGTPDNQLLLAAARDDTLSDSLHLYIDVAIENAGSDVVHIPQNIKTLSLRARVTFVDLPYKRHFRSGKLKLVIGWTDGGLQASEAHEVEFATDSALVLDIPMSRVDSLRVADNVAVYGEVLAPGKFIRAGRVRVFDTPSAPTAPKPDLAGYVRQVDSRARRLLVSNATVVLGDTTRIEDSNGALISPDALTSGANDFTVTALAWAFTTGVGMTANGWEFRRFTVNVARPITP